MDELIRKQDALDALMAERKRLLAKGQKGAEHVLTHHGYNVIDELPPVQPKHGRWIERNPLNSDKCRLIECDQCGKSYIVGFNVPYEHWIENKNYCEKCGADMRGNENGRND